MRRLTTWPVVCIVEKRCEFRTKLDLRASTMPQRGFELRIRELETGGGEGARFDTGAAEQHVVGHFAEGQPGGKGRHREDGGPTEHAAERFGELAIGDRMRRDGVDRAAQRGSGRARIESRAPGRRA